MIRQKNERRKKMKGFIEITAKDGRKRLLNINRIEEVINSTIYLDVINPDAVEQDHVKCEESYEEIKAKIAEAVEDKIVLPELKKVVIGDDVVMPALDISQQKTDEELIERYYKNANKEWIIT